MAGALIGFSLLWALIAPAYAAGLTLAGRLVAPALEHEPTTRYAVEGSRIVAYRQMWLPKRGRTAPLVQPLWVGENNFGPPLMAAFILATPGWGWRRRGRALLTGLGLLTLTQIAYLIVATAVTQDSPVMSPAGLLPPSRHPPFWQPILYWLYYFFFDIMGRGFFALLIWTALIAVPPGRDHGGLGAAMGRNAPCACGSGLKYKRCCGRS